MLFFLGFIFLFIYYPKITFEPNSYLFNFQGDGLTSYYNYTYHIQYDSSFIEFKGMNYPYSEHIIYSVNNPLLSNSIKFISTFWPGIKNFSVGIHNFSFLIGMLLCVIFLYLILRNYGVDIWFSVLFAFGLMILSPQIHRISGHYSLAYLFFIPQSWYFLIKHTKASKKIIWDFVLIMNSLLWMFIHPYLGMITTVFIFSFSLICFILNYRSLKQKLFYGLRMFIIVFSPIIIFRFFVFFTDIHIGRTSNPYGFMVFIAKLETVFLPSNPPFHSIINSLISINQQIWEGWAYIGMTSIFGIILFLFISIKENILGVKLNLFNKYFPDKQLQSFTIAGFLILLFSMGYPFRLGLQNLADIIPAFKEFRAVGRFAWVWYYIINIATIYFFYNFFNSFSKKWKFAKIFVLIILGCLIIFEGLSYHKNNKKFLFQYPNYFNKELLPQNLKDALERIKVDEFQAIIPIPYYSKGSESFEIQGTYQSIFASTLISFHTGLPILGNYLARTSIPESKKVSQLISPSFIKKEIEKDIKSDKKFLLIYTKEKISVYQQQIINKAKILYEDESLLCLEIGFSEFFKNSSNEIIDNFKNSKSSYYINGSCLVNIDSSYLYYDSFDQENSNISYLGKSALKAHKSEHKTICSIDATLLNVSKKYTLSFWMYNAGKNFGQDVLNCKVKLFKLNFENESKLILEFKPMFCEIIDGDWSRIELEFEITEKDKSINLIITSDTDDCVSEYIIDELLIKEKSMDVYKIMNTEEEMLETLFFNGFKISSAK